jgi:hypothetical protein
MSMGWGRVPFWFFGPAILDIPVATLLFNFLFTMWFRRRYDEQNESQVR